MASFPLAFMKKDGYTAAQIESETNDEKRYSS